MFSGCGLLLLCQATSPFFATFWAAKLLSSLGLGVVVSTTASDAGGKPGWFCVKRSICARARAVLTALGFSDASTPTISGLAEIAAKPETVPLRASAVDWTGHVFPTEASNLLGACNMYAVTRRYKMQCACTTHLLRS